MAELMKTLTLTEPWATLVAIGAKRIETRSWSTSYRGPLAIHAAKGMPEWAEMVCYDEPFFSVLRDYLSADIVRKPATAWFPRGSVIATVTLVDCLPIQANSGKRPCVAPDDEGLIRTWHPNGLFGGTLNVGGMTTPHEAAFGDYTPGRYAWLLTDVQPLRKPVPARGSLGLWDWEPNA